MILNDLDVAGYEGKDAGSLYDSMVNETQHPWEDLTREEFVRKFPAARAMVISFFETEGFGSGICTLLSATKSHPKRGWPEIIETRYIALL